MDTFNTTALVAISIKCRQQDGREHLLLGYTLKHHKFWLYKVPTSDRPAAAARPHVYMPVRLSTYLWNQLPDAFRHLNHSHYDPRSS